MKTARLILLGSVLTALMFPSTAHAQYNRAKELARRVAPGPAQPTPRGPVQPTPTQVQPPAPTTQTPNPSPAPSSTPTPIPVQVPTRSMPGRAPVVRATAPVDPAKAQAAKDEATRRAVEFQKKRAEEGSPSAQYELGMRYIKGDGVERDEAKGRELLESSAKNGNRQSAKKLAELDKDRIDSKKK